MAGVDIPTITELMGHKRIQMSMPYAHLAPAHNLAAVERLLTGRWREQVTPELTPASHARRPNRFSSRIKLFVLC